LIRALATHRPEGVSRDKQDRESEFHTGTHESRTSRILLRLSSLLKSAPNVHAMSGPGWNDRIAGPPPMLSVGLPLE
jgi:hypothetical protein